MADIRIVPSAGAINVTGSADFRGTGGSTILYLTGSGQIGAGTTNPDSEFHIVGSGTRFVTLDRSGTRSYDLGVNSAGTMLVTDNTVSADRISLSHSGSVGIGTTGPLSLLHLRSSEPAIRIVDTDDSSTTIIGSTSGYSFIRPFSRDFRVINDAGTGLLTVKTGGSVGIGTTGPTKALHVVGEVRLSSYGAGTVTGTAARSLAVDSSGNIIEVANSSLAGSGTANRVAYWTDSNTIAADADFSFDGTNVGIGTTAPATKLQVNGTFASNALWTDSGAVSYWGSYSTAYGGLTWDTGYATVFATGGNKLHLGSNGSSPDITIGTDGNVGIGTTSPNYKLHISGGSEYIEGGFGGNTATAYTATNRLIFNNDYSDTARGPNKITLYDASWLGGFGVHSDTLGYYSGGTHKWYQATDATNAVHLMTLNSSGNLGIGTTSPNRQLTFGTKNEDAIQIRRLTTSEGYAAAGTGISWTWSSAGTDNETWAAIRVIMPGNSNSNMTFSTTPALGGASGLTERMRITDAGNVGIGYTSANQRLVVAGNIAVSSSNTEGAIWLGQGQDIGLFRNNTYDLVLSQEASSGNPLYLAGAGDVIVSIDSNNNSTGNKFTIGSNAVKASNELFSVNESGNVYVSNDLNVDGKITAREFHTSFVSASIIYQSGSTQFGNSSDDTHVFTGNVGIGTTSPGSRLTVIDSNNTTPLTIGAGSSATFEFKGNSTSGYTTTFNINDTALYIGHNSSGRNLVLQTNSTDRLTIGGSGAATFSSSVTAVSALLQSANTNSVVDIFTLYNPSQTSSGVRQKFANGYGDLAAIKVSQIDNGAGADNGQIEFQTATDAALSTKLTILDTGAATFASSVTAGSFVKSGGTSAQFLKADGSVDSSTYLTAFSETDTLQSVTTRGSATTTGMTIAGDVGIGTTAPSRRLTVSQGTGTNTNSYMSFNNSAERWVIGNEGGFGGGTSNDFIIYDTAYRLVVKAGGNVGIGTTNPTYNLEVKGAGTANGILAGFTGTGPSGSISIGHSANGGAIGYANVGATSNLFYVTTGAGTIGSGIVMDNNGNLGIGTTNPTRDLQIGSLASTSTATPKTFSLGGTYSNSAGNNVKLKVYDDDGSNVGGMSVSGGQMEVNTWSSGKIAFYRGTTQTMIIDEAGDVGIGTSSPSGDLHVYSSATTGGIRVGGSNGTGNSRIFIEAAGENNYIDSYGDSNYKPLAIETSILRLNASSGGNVGIGLTNPGVKLDVNGSGRFSGGLIYLGNYSGNPEIILQATNNSWSKINFYDNNSTEGLYIRTDGESYGGTMTFGARWDDDEPKIVFKMYQTSAGASYDQRVGIGLTNPGGILTVQGASNQLVIGSTWSSGNHDIVFAGGSANSTGGTTNTAARIRSLATAPGGAATGDLLFTVNNGDSLVNALYIKQDGNVGIGTTGPTAKLHVSGGDAVLRNAFIGEVPTYGAENSQFSHISRAVAGEYSFLSANDGTTFINAKTGFDINFRINNSNVAVIKSSGNVGIGTTAPRASLDVAGGITIRNTRVSTAEKYPLGHYTPGETVFEIDPTWTEAQLQDYFNSTGVSWTADSTSPGGYAIQIDGEVNVGGEYNTGFPYIPVDSSQDDWFYMECWIRNEAGSVNQHYMGGIDYNESFSSLGGNPGSYTYNVMSNYSPGTSWTKVYGYWNGFGNSYGGAGTGNTNNWESGTKYFTPQALFNYSNPSGTRRSYISGWKCVRVRATGNRYYSDNVLVGGSVGVGTTSPSTKLQIIGGNTAEGQLYVGNTDVTYSAGINFYTSTTSRGFVGWRHTNSGAPFTLTGIHLFNTDNSNIVFGTNNLVRAVINTNGSVGIGTTTPDSLLHINGSGNTFTRYTNTTSAGHYIDVGANSAGESFVYSYGAYPLLIGTNGATRMTVLAGGNIGVGGQTSPNGYLAFPDDTQTRKIVLWDGSANNNFQFYGLGIESSTFLHSIYDVTDRYLWTAGVNSGARSEIMVLQGNGNLGIGITNPSAKFYVNNSGGTGNPFYVDLGNPGGATTLFEHTGASTPVPFRLRKTGFAGASPNYGLLYLHMNDSTISNGSNLYFTLNDSAGNEHEYAGLGGTIRSNTNGAEQGDLFFMTSDNGTTRSEKMRIKSDGNVGIGTDNPAVKFHVQGSNLMATLRNSSTSADQYSQLEFIAGSRSAYIWLGNQATTSWAGDGGLNIYTTTGHMDFWTAAAQKMRLTSAGALVVGTTSTTNTASGKIVNQTAGSSSPDLGLNSGAWSIASIGGEPALYLSSNIVAATGVASATQTAKGGIGFEYVSATAPTTMVMGIFGNSTVTSNLRIFNGTERITVTPTGNVGIGTTSPNYKLEVSGQTGLNNGTGNALFINTDVADNNTRDAIYLYEDDGQASGRQAISWYNGNGGGGSYYKARLWTQVGSSYVATVFGIDVANDAQVVDTRLAIRNGNVGIGSITPAYKLDVAGTIRATGDVIAYSDARVKENIVTLENSLDLVQKLRGVRYNRIGESEKKVGVIAQEVLEVLPEVVQQDQEGNYSVAYGNITAVLIEAIKQQQLQIDELKAEIKQLKG